jgi:hypothetical protein
MGTALFDRYFAQRMDTYRLTKVTLPDQWPWPEPIQDDLRRLMAGNRVDKAVAIFLNGVLTSGWPVVAVSRNDLEALIGHYSSETGQEPFLLRSTARGTPKTLYAAFWAAIEKKTGLAKFLLTSEPRRPAVVEILHPDYLALLKPVTDELRQTVLKAARP